MKLNLKVNVRYLTIFSLMSWLFPAAIFSQSPEIGKSSDGRFLFSFNGGWSHPKMEDLRGFYDEFLGSVLKDKLELGARVQYFPSKNISIGVGISYMRTGAEGKTTYEYRDLDGNILFVDIAEYSLHASAIYPHLIMRYLFSFKDRDYYISVGQGFCFGTAQRYWRQYGGYFEDSFDRQYRSGGPGFLLAAGTSYNFHKSYAANIEMGYRYLVTAELVNGDGEYVIVGSDGRGANLDFSGIYISGGISFRL